MHEAAQALTLMNVSKAFGSEAIVKNLNISANKGEFITLLGPSGCGKTTTIRLIAGLETLDSGAILLGGADISRLEPNERPVNTVFQNYALFPHLNVYKNISYGLRIKNTQEAEVRKRVCDMLALVKMEGYEKRMPNQLSGGQRQRVAIARALINRPAVLLLDEPLGALDLKLRQHMQQELKRIQRHTSITFVYVTHDQGEALNMSSRIAVMNKGVFEQVGTPEDIYNHPRTRFVAGFVGDRNIFAADVARLRDRKAVVAVHSDKMVIGNDPHSLPFGPRLRGAVLEARYTGSQRSFSVLTENGQVISVLQYNPAADAVDCGEDVYVGWRGEDGVVISGRGVGE